MAQAGFTVSSPEIVLISRGGFTESVRTLAEQNDRIRLVDATTVLTR